MNSNETQTLKRLVSLKDIKGALACWVCRQHPYNLVDNVNEANFKLECAVNTSTEWDRLGSFISKYFDSVNQLEEFIKSVLDGSPEFKAWNTPEKDTAAKFLFVSRYSGPDAEHDFIDTGALTRNIAQQVWKESEEYTG